MPFEVQKAGAQRNASSKFFSVLVFPKFRQQSRTESTIGKAEIQLPGHHSLTRVLIRLCCAYSHEHSVAEPAKLPKSLTSEDNLQRQNSQAVGFWKFAVLEESQWFRHSGSNFIKALSLSCSAVIVFPRWAQSCSG